MISCNIREKVFEKQPNKDKEKTDSETAGVINVAVILKNL